MGDLSDQPSELGIDELDTDARERTQADSQLGGGTTHTTGDGRGAVEAEAPLQKHAAPTSSGKDAAKRESDISFDVDAFLADVMAPSSKPDKDKPAPVTEKQLSATAQQPPPQAVGSEAVGVSFALPQIEEPDKPDSSDAITPGPPPPAPPTNATDGYATMAGAEPSEPVDPLSELEELTRGGPETHRDDAQEETAEAPQDPSAQVELDIGAATPALEPPPPAAGTVSVPMGTEPGGHRPLVRSMGGDAVSDPWIDTNDATVKANLPAAFDMPPPGEPPVVVDTPGLEGTETEASATAQMGSESDPMTDLPLTVPGLDGGDGGVPEGPTIAAEDDDFDTEIVVDDEGNVDLTGDVTRAPPPPAPAPKPTIEPLAETPQEDASDAPPPQQTRDNAFEDRFDTDGFDVEIDTDGEADATAPRPLFQLESQSPEGDDGSEVANEGMPARPTMDTGAPGAEQSDTDEPLEFAVAPPAPISFAEPQNKVPSGSESPQLLPPISAPVYSALLDQQFHGVAHGNDVGEDTVDEGSGETEPESTAPEPTYNAAPPPAPTTKMEPVAEEEVAPCEPEEPEPIAATFSGPPPAYGTEADDSDDGEIDHIDVDLSLDAADQPEPEPVATTVEVSAEESAATDARVVSGPDDADERYGRPEAALRAALAGEPYDAQDLPDPQPFLVGLARAVIETGVSSETIVRAVLMALQERFGTPNEPAEES